MDPIEEKLKLLQPVLPPASWRYLHLQYVLEKDYRKRQATEAMINMLIARHVPGLVSESILLPPPPAKSFSGDYPVGRVIYPERPLGTFGIRKDEWLRHVGLFGKTGSGKTTLAIHLIEQLCRHGHPFLIFDYKRNYRDLLKHPVFENENILIFTVGKNEVVPFYFNPKSGPQGVPDYVWNKHLAQIIEKVYLLGPGANDVFMESTGLPTFKQMQDQVLRQRKRARELLWWASVKRTLNAINYPGLGEMVNCNQGYPIESLLQKKVILELDGLSASDQAFVIGSLLLWIYHFRMQQREREVLKHLIVIEEAHHLFLKTGREEDIADVIMREIRELGESIVIIDQHPSKISVSALGNLATKFALTLSLNEDVAALANAMLLERDQKKYLAMLKVGQCICRSDRLAQPVLLAIDNFALKKGQITDEDLKTHMRAYLDNLRPNVATIQNPGGIRPIPQRQSLSPLAKIMLDHIAQKPLLGVVKRFNHLGLKVAQGYKIIDELSLAQLIRARTIDGHKLYEPTAAGRDVLGKTFSHRGRGGLEHRYYVEKIKAHYMAQKGFTFLEKDDIDLVVETVDRKLAVQVETGKSDLQANLSKLGRYPADLKYVVAVNKSTEIHIGDLLKNYLIPNKENIRVVYVKDFLINPPILSR